MLTNLDAPDFRVMTAPLDDPGEWDELLPHVAGRRITSAEPFAGHLILHEWADAQPRIRVRFRDGTEEVLDFGTEPHDVELGANPEWDTSSLRLGYQSLTTPSSVYDHDVVTGERILRKQTPTPNVDLTKYVSTRTWARSPDGTAVPVDVVRHVDTAVDGSAPCVVYAYGSYEASLPPWFSVARLSLLDRGVTWVLVHPRGGGELGRRWYLDGRLLNKRNTFVDTLAAVEHITAEGWADPRRVAVRGGSAGGLMVGACVTTRPDLFASAVAEVPFVDVVTTMSDPSLPLTANEWEEWGDPRVEPYATYMLGYSPYDNTEAADYPALYVTAGLERSPCRLPRAGQVGGQAARGRRRRRPSVAPPDRDGRRPRRPHRPLRRLAGRGPGPHLPPAARSDHPRVPRHPRVSCWDSPSRNPPMTANPRMMSKGPRGRRTRRRSSARCGRGGRH